MSESFLFLFEGGPYAGETKLPKRGQKFEWPLADTILAIDHKSVRNPDGYYSKIWESQGEPKPGQARGARYKWIPYESETEPDMTGLL